MRVLHVIASTDMIYGGPPLIASHLAAAQAGLCPGVGLLSYEPLKQESSILPRLRQLPGGDKVQLHLAGRLVGSELYTASRARALYRSIRDRYDVLHIHGVWDAVLWMAGAEARKARTPYTVVLHGMLDPWTLSQSRLKKRIALAFFARRYLDHAAFLHLGNDDERRLIHPLGLKAQGELIPNGVFLEEYANLPAPGSFYAKHPELQGRPYILFLSRLHLKKGLDYLADAFAVVAKDRPEVVLVVAGPDGGYKATFEQMIARHGLTDRTFLVGGLYADEKLAAFRDAAAFCLPSRQEGFSIAITESLACGTPTVVSQDCHYPEVAQVGAGEVVALEPRAIGSALLRVLDPKNRDAFARAGQKLVRERFNWPKAAEIAFAAYRRHGASPAAGGRS